MLLSVGLVAFFLFRMGIFFGRVAFQSVFVAKLRQGYAICICQFQLFLVCSSDFYRQVSLTRCWIGTKLNRNVGALPAYISTFNDVFLYFLAQK